MKKLLALLMAALMLLGCMTACGTKEEKPTEPTQGASETKDQSDEPIKIVVYNNSGIITSSEASDPAIIAQIHDWLLEETGYDVEIKTPSAEGSDSTELNLLLGSGAQIDLFWGDWTTYSANGAILPLNEYLDSKGDRIVPAWTEQAWAAMTDNDGKIYGIPRSTPVSGNPMWVRTDWLEQFGMKQPETIEDYEAYLAKVVEEKPAGEGTIALLADIDGKHNSKGLHNTFMGAFTEYGYSNWKDEATGEIKPAELQDGFKDFLATMNEWYKAGYIYPEFANLDVTTIRDLIKSGVVGSTAVWYSNLTLSMYDFQKNFPDAGFDYCHTGLKGEAGFAETAKAASTHGALISAGCKHPEAVVDLLNFLYDPDNYMISWYGPEGMFWKWTDKENHIYETIGEISGYHYEYCLTPGLPCETSVSGNNPQQARHQEFLKNEHPDLSRVKTHFDDGIVYDEATTRAACPTYDDIQRMLQEETVKFIMGTRDLGEFDQFVSELYDAGMQSYIDTLTEQYNAQIG